MWAGIFFFPSALLQLLLFSYKVVWLFVTPVGCNTTGSPILHYLPVCSNSCPLKVKVKVAQSCPTLWNPMDSTDSTTVHEILQARILEWVAGPFSRKSSQLGLNPVLPHCRRILYQLSHQGSPRILEKVAYLFFSRSSQTRNQTQVSCIVGGFFTSWATKEAYVHWVSITDKQNCKTFEV